jgi:hypothetical protein
MLGVGESPLKDTFPGLFSIARFREASIADNMERSNGTIQWNIVFSRLIHDWEVEILASFFFFFDKSVYYITKKKSAKRL